MMRSFLLMLCGVCVLGVLEVAAQMPQGFQTPDPGLESERQTWLTYERELRAWCTQYYPASSTPASRQKWPNMGCHRRFSLIFNSSPKEPMACVL